MPYGVADALIYIIECQAPLYARYRVSDTLPHYQCRRAASPSRASMDRDHREELGVRPVRGETTLQRLATEKRKAGQQRQTAIG